jgi:hypothetical protein
MGRRKKGYRGYKESWVLMRGYVKRYPDTTVEELVEIFGEMHYRSEEEAIRNLRACLDVIKLYWNYVQWDREGKKFMICLPKITD